MSKIYGAIEAGGTKFVCAVSDEKMNILKRVKIPTTVPEETMAEVFKFFDENPVCAMGIGSFGPIDAKARLGKLRLPWRYEETLRYSLCLDD